MDVIAISDGFWTSAGGRRRFGSPADIATAGSVAHRLAVVEIPSLDTTAATRMVPTMSTWFCGPPRPMRGCLLADVGHALVLIDANDTEEERRFTIAHEIAHLLLHYLQPRARALREFGPGFAAVLDRTRPPTAAELLSSAIRDIPIEPFQHAMDRNVGAARSVDLMEDQADDLAVELLAPWRELQAMRGATPGQIRNRFGLPPAISSRIAGLIAPSKTTIGVLRMFAPK